MSALGTLRTSLSPDLGLDLGTSNTVVYGRGAGAIVSEPTVIAYDARRSEVVAIGTEARAMEGRTPPHIRVVRPLRRGTISDFRGAQTLVARLVERALASHPRLAPRVVASIPGCATDIECKAVEQAVRATGARWATYLTQAVAAALGAGLDVERTRAQMIVDIGGGTTEIAIVGLAGVLALRSVQVGGETLDAAICARLRAERFEIGPSTAERIKLALGAVGRLPGRAPLVVSGRDLGALAPRTREVSETLVAEAIGDGVARIVGAIRSVIEAAPPEVAVDLLESGITLCGGGALLCGLAHEVGARTNVPATIAPEPLFCAAKGAGEILGSPSLLEALRPHGDRVTRWYQSLRIGMRESYSP
ncbi:MAG: rod shape-determining protein [Vulcanimicrobiaceae bacterium]